jgi:hypothetical protein
MPIHALLGAPKSSEHNNKQSALALLSKTPSITLSLCLPVCRGSLPVQVESSTIPVGPGLGISIFSCACLRVFIFILRSASCRLYPVPPCGASILFRLVAPLYRSASRHHSIGLPSTNPPSSSASFGVQISLHHADGCLAGFLVRFKLHRVRYIQPSPPGRPTPVLAVARHSATRQNTQAFVHTSQYHFHITRQQCCSAAEPQHP